MGFTNTDEIIIDDVSYRANTVLNISGVETTNNFSVDNLDITGVLDSPDLKEHEILSGKYDFAEIEVFTTSLTDTTQKTIQRRGWLGEITLRGTQFVAEIRGLTQKLQCSIGDLYGPTCRATFGDNRCKAKLADYTFKGTVDVVSGRQMFTATGYHMNQEAGYFTGGKIVWLTGANAGLSMEIKEFENRRFILVMNMPHPIKESDTFNAVAGCDKAFTTCCNKFKNAVNFRGEPHVPGVDIMLATPFTTNNLNRS